MVHTPLMRGHPGRLSEAASEMTNGHPALLSQFTYRRVLCEIGQEPFLSAAFLPRRKPSPVSSSSNTGPLAGLFDSRRHGSNDLIKKYAALYPFGIGRVLDVAYRILRNDPNLRVEVGHGISDFKFMSRQVLHHVMSPFC